MSVSAKEAREWAQSNLKGLLDSPYTPFCGKDGDGIDYEALRKLIRYCLKDLKHDGIYIGGIAAEFTALTVDERKKIAEAAIDEINKVNPKAIKIVGTHCLPVKDCVELTNHAKAIGADMAIIITPYYLAWGALGVKAYYKYVAERTNIPLAIQQSFPTGWIMSPAEIADLYNEIPALCAIKNAARKAGHSEEVHKLAPRMVIWETDLFAAGPGGLMKRGIVAPIVMGTGIYVYEVPDKLLYTQYFNLVVEGKFAEANELWFTSGLREIYDQVIMECPGRPGVLSHWGSTDKYRASLLGLPVGDYPHSRPPQYPMPEELKRGIRDAYVKAGYI